MRNHARLALLACIGPTAASAQVQSSVIHVPLDSGTLVRMTPRTGEPFEGRLLQPFRPETGMLHFCRYPAPPCTDATDTAAVRHIPAASLLGVQVKRGTHAGSGALIGGLIGAALGSFGRSIGQGLCESQECLRSADAEPVLLGLFGALIGAAFGAASPRWGGP